MEEIRIGIVGIGHLGAYHLKCYSELAPKARIVGLCDIKEDRTERLASHYKIPVFTDYKDLLGSVDAVSICTPTECHHEVAKFFIAKGIHALIEKPITKTVAEAEELIALAEKHNVTLQTGHVERFNAAFQSIMHFTKHPLFIECHRLNQFSPRSLDIGVVMDLMIHDIDIVLGLNQGVAIEDIQATGVNVLTPLEDIASVRIRFANGCVCNLTASRISEEVMRKIRIFQKDTYISLDYVQQEAFIYRKNGQQILKHALPIEKEQPLKKELDHFLDCIIKKERPYVSGYEGKEALRVALEISQKIWDLHKSTSLL